MKRKLRIDLSDLQMVFEDNFHEHHYYLDVETGEVVLVSDEIRSALERIYEDNTAEEGHQKRSFAEAVAESGLSDWMKDMVLDADRVEQGFGARFIEIAKVQTSEDYRAMEDFTESLEDQRLQERLWRALNGRRPFRHFKDVLMDYPEEEQQWFKFLDARHRGQLLEWLEEEEIDPIID